MLNYVIDSESINSNVTKNMSQIYDDRPGLIEVRLVQPGEGYKPWV